MSGCYDRRTPEQLADDNRLLQSQLDGARRVEEQRREQEQRERETRRRESRDRMRENECHAATWEEAFPKQLRRLDHELRETRRFNATLEEGEEAMPEEWWSDEIAATHRAAALYAELQAKIAAFVATEMLRIADAVATEFPKSSAVDALRENDPDKLVYW